jgi:ribosomal-protein-alanine N-acetyltransferase
MRLQTERLVLRRWRLADQEPLVRHANNRNVSINLRDLFPYPYTAEHAREWIARQTVLPDPPQNLVIEHAGEFVGNVGLNPLSDVCRFTAEVGYWLGEDFWGRGFASEALANFTAYVFATFPFERLEAWVFSSNPASQRVLEKAGYEHEATMRRSIFKEGRFLDSHVYVRFRPR